MKKAYFIDDGLMKIILSEFPRMDITEAKNFKQNKLEKLDVKFSLVQDDLVYRINEIINHINKEV